MAGGIPILEKECEIIYSDKSRGISRGSFPLFIMKILFAIFSSTASIKWKKCNGSQCLQGGDAIVEAVEAKARNRHIASKKSHKLTLTS